MPDDEQPFHEWLQERARYVGYDIDGARSGGKAQLAAASGVSRGQVGRALTGENIPDIRSQRGLARALNMTPLEMFIRSGALVGDDLFNAATGKWFGGDADEEVDLSQFTAGEDTTNLVKLAAQLGVSPYHHAEFAGLVEALAVLAHDQTSAESALKHIRALVDALNGARSA